MQSQVLKNVKLSLNLQGEAHLLLLLITSLSH
jgi:hypothetical protein